MPAKKDLVGKKQEGESKNGTSERWSNRIGGACNGRGEVILDGIVGLLVLGSYPSKFGPDWSVVFQVKKGAQLDGLTNHNVFFIRINVKTQKIAVFLCFHLSFTGFL